MLTNPNIFRKSFLDSILGLNMIQKSPVILKICSFFEKFLKIDVYHILINLEIFIKILIVWIFKILEINVVQSSFEI